MQIPTTIKIGGKDFKVELKDNLRRENGQVSCGQCNASEQIITINPGFPQQTQESTLLHEILEAIDHMYELEMPHRVVCVLEETLYQVIRDNKLHF